MTTWQAMHTLEGLGYQFELTDNGAQATLYGTKPPEASALLDIITRDRDAARAYVEARRAGASVTDDGLTYSLFDALAIAQAVRKGEARLLGKVVFHRQPLTVTVRWDALTDENPADMLQRYRERLKSALIAKITAMEAETYWDYPEDKYARFCAQYERYNRLLEGYGDNSYSGFH